MQTLQMQDLSIHARIALCLTYIEKMIAILGNIIESHEEYIRYSQGKKQIYDILDLAWGYLTETDVDWTPMYELCKGKGESEQKYGGRGYFDFVMAINASKNENEALLSNMIIYSFYYAMYHFAVRQDEKPATQDIGWFSVPSNETKAFTCINKAVNIFLPSDELVKISTLKEKLFSNFRFDAEDPYGKYISKGDVFILFIQLIRKEDMTNLFPLDDDTSSLYEKYLFFYTMLDQKEKEILERMEDISLEDILYSKYYWFLKLKKEHEKTINGEDAGFDQRAFELAVSIYERSDADIDVNCLEAVENLVYPKLSNA